MANRELSLSTVDGKGIFKESACVKPEKDLEKKKSEKKRIRLKTN